MIGCDDIALVDMMTVAIAEYVDDMWITRNTAATVKGRLPGSGMSTNQKRTSKRNIGKK